MKTFVENVITASWQQQTTLQLAVYSFSSIGGFSARHHTMSARTTDLKPKDSSTVGLTLPQGSLSSPRALCNNFGSGTSPTQK